MTRGRHGHTARPYGGPRKVWHPTSEDDFCERCGLPIRWAWTEANKKMPVDPDEADRDDAAANLAVWRNHLRRLCVRVITAERPLLGFEHRGIPHFATCPPLVAERDAKRAVRESRRAAAAATPDVTEPEQLRAARRGEDLPS